MFRFPLWKRILFLCLVLSVSLKMKLKKTTVCVAPLGVGQGGAPKAEGVGMVHEKGGKLIAKVD